MLEIFQQAYEIKCSPCLPEEKERNCVILESVIGKKKRNLCLDRHVIEALGKQTSTSSQKYKYNPRARGSKKDIHFL